MIYLNPIRFESKAVIHLNKLKPKIKTRLLKNKAGLPNYLIKFITKNLDTILSGKPNEIIKINKAFFGKIEKLKNRKKKELIKKTRVIFDYDNFVNKKKRQYDAYDLAELLNLRTCTYCNRIYTITVIYDKSQGGQITRPQFDHYFPKEENPLLALSFYNLIPSCSICNSTLKGRQELNLSTHLHPYIDDCYKHFNFSYAPKNLSSAKGASPQHKVIIKTDKNVDAVMAKKIESTFDIFKIKETYNGHMEEVSELLRIRDLMSEKYLEILRKTYNLRITDDELYRLAFGTYREEVNFHKRPFSKLKKDILKEHKMI